MNVIERDLGHSNKAFAPKIPGPGSNRIPLTSFPTLAKIIPQAMLTGHLTIPEQGQHNSTKSSNTHTRPPTNDANEEDIRRISDFYGTQEELLRSERSLFRSLYSNKMKTAEDCVQLLAENGFDKTLPHFAKAARILASIPATSSSAERSFSGLRRLKTYLRSTTGQARLSNIAVLHLEREAVNRIDIECIIDIFAQRHGRSKYFFQLQVFQ